MPPKTRLESELLFISGVSRDLPTRPERYSCRTPNRPNNSAVHRLKRINKRKNRDSTDCMTALFCAHRSRQIHSPHGRVLGDGRALRDKKTSRNENHSYNT